jgi:hypothetical protein
MLIPRKRAILAAHRWLGLVSALFLVVLALTGLLLNHAERLGLRDIKVKSSILLGQYDMLGKGDISSFRIGDSDVLSHLDNGLYFNGVHCATSGPVVGIHEGEAFLVVASNDQLTYLTVEGELIEVVSTSFLPFEEILYLGDSESTHPVVVSSTGQFLPDSDWLAFTKHDGDFRVSPLEEFNPEGDLLDAVLEYHQGQGLSLYRVLLDLHAGRLFGWGGRTAMDLTAVAILVLVFSGIAGWLRKARRGRGFALRK